MTRLIAVLVLIMVASLPAHAEDMQKYLRDTQTLVREGKHKEALDRFLWFHDHALEHAPSMYGVRLSFALMYWKQLGDVYPPALTAIKKTRDDKTAILKEEKGNRTLFHDVTALNRTLDENDRTVDLFQQLDENQKELASECWDIAKDAIIAAKRYDLARKYIGSFVKAFTKVKAMYDENTTLYDNPQMGGDRFKAYNENHLVEESLQLIEVALALDDTKSATEIQQKALAILDDHRLRDAIPKERTGNAQPNTEGDGLKPAP